jgi:transcriptional regulator of nitric oxide reductase
MNLEVLEAEQSAMQERQKVARSQRARKSAGNRKRKRTRVSIKKLLVDLASQSKAHGKVRAWAIQQLLLLGGKPVQPFKESYDEPELEPKPEKHKFTGADLGTVAART